jgi:hypothetical protein
VTFDYVIGPFETEAQAFNAADAKCRRLGCIAQVEGGDDEIAAWLERLQSYGAAVCVVLGGLMFVRLVQ